MRYSKIFFAIFVGIMLTYFVIGEKFAIKDSPDNDYRCQDFNEGWVGELIDGTTKEVTLPYKFDIKRDELLIIYNTLPDDIKGDDCICFRGAKQDMEIYIDGQLRKTYSTQNTRVFGNNSAAVYLIVKLDESDSSKEIRVKMRTDSTYTGNVYAVLLGNRMGIWHHLFKKYGAELVVAVMTVLLGLLCVIVSLALSIKYRKRLYIEYLGWAILICAFWIITNSVFRQLMFPNISVINDMPFMALMILPLPFLVYMNNIQKERYVKIYRFLGALCIVDFILFTVLHVLKIVDFTQTIKFMSFICLVSILMMGITMIVDWRKGNVKEYKLVALGVMGASISAVIQMISYFRRTGTFSGALLAIGLMILLLFSVINAISDVLMLERQKQDALMSSMHKARFLANMSHEIRTPINAILGMDTMILRECKDDNIKEYAFNIHNAGQNLLALINDILDFSKIESGKMEIIESEYDVSSLFNDVINMISVKAQSKGLSFILSIDDNMPSFMYGDDVRIRQILINLLNNAVKYTEEGSVGLIVTWNINEPDDGTANVTYLVEDTGIGIKPEDMNKLTAEFERIEEKRNKNVEGTGLGMSITTHLLELMNSKLVIESEYGVGSSFSFTINQKIINKEPIGNLDGRLKNQAADYSYSTSFVAPKAHVLVVDDNEMNRRVFCGLLKETKVNIEEANGGREGLEKITNTKYDVIFLDHMMPDLDGIEVIHAMKQMPDCVNKNTPVIALTANAITGAKEMYLEEGFADFLSKPIKPDRLESMMMRYLPNDIFVTGSEIDKENCSTENMRVDVDDIDYDYALMHMNNEELLLMTIVDFYEMNDGEVLKVKKCYEDLIEAVNMKSDNDSISDEKFNECLKQYRVQVHSMKSQAMIIGAVGIGGMAKLLEHSAINEDLETIQSVTQVFINEWINLKTKLKGALLEIGAIKESADELKQRGSLESIIGEMSNLMSAILDMDIDRLDEIMYRINEYSYEGELKGIIQALSDAVKNLDETKTQQIIMQIYGLQEGD